MNWEQEASILIDDALGQGFFPGAVLGVEKGSFRFTKAWGDAVREQESLTVEHLFDLASLTKLFTAAAIFVLFDRQKLTEHTRVLDVLEFQYPPLVDRLADVDIASLLTHTSSLPAWYPFYTSIPDSFETILARACERYPIPSGVLYSDLNFMLLGMILEAVLQMPLAQCIKNLVLDPLSLHATTYFPRPKRCVATEYGNQIEQEMVRSLGLSFSSWRNTDIAIQAQCNDGNGYYFFKGVSGHAGLFSDVSDMLAFGHAFLPGSSFFSASLKERIFHDWGENRGYGFATGDLYPGGGFGHTGFTGTYLYVNPGKDLVITLLASRLQMPVVKNINVVRSRLAQLIVSAF